MKNLKLLGICIVFLLALTAVNAQEINETLLDQLLSGYDNSYDNGNFDVEFSGKSYNRTWGIWNGTVLIDADSGANMLNFTITGPGTSSQYTAVATLNIRNAKYEELGGNGFLGGNIIREITKASPGLTNFVFDGKYYKCPATGNVNNTLQVELKIYQQDIIQYQDDFNFVTPCWTAPARFDYTNSKTMQFVDNVGDARYDFVNLTLLLKFKESGTYTIGAYLWDNKSSTAYAETVINLPLAGYTFDIPDLDYYINKEVSIIFDSNEFKDFDLSTEKIFLKSISVDGNIMDTYHKTPYQSFYGIYDDISFYNMVHPTINLNTANFAFADFFITNYIFTRNFDSTGRIKELSMTLIASDAVAPPYDIEMSLENQYGEVVEVQNKSGSFLTVFTFNGTDIYNSRINGPYRVGFVRVTKGSNRLLYELNKGLSLPYSYINFTSPPMPDLEINDSDLVLDGTDINVTIHNRAAGDAAGVVVSVFDNSANKVKEVLLEKIPAGTSYDYVFKNIGLTNAFVVVDFTNEVEEVNESNNIASLIPPNSPPILNAIGNKAATENVLLTFSVSATDAESDPLTYSATGLPAGASFNPATRTFTWTPGFADAGSYPVTFIVDDGTDTDSEAITITVGNSNRVPVITSTAGTTATRGVVYSYTMTATDADLDPLAYSVNDARFAKTGNVFTWTPGGSSDYGVITPTFSVSDGITTVNQPVSITVLEDVYTIKAATLDYNERENSNYVYISSQISINAQTQNSVGATSASFTVNANTEYTITHSAVGYQTDADYVYFDSRLASCITGTNCNFVGTYTTSCTWEATSSNWYCSIQGGTLPKETWFRYDRNPTQVLKRVNYLLRN